MSCILTVCVFSSNLIYVYSADPSLNELLVYYLKESGRTVVGRVLAPGEIATETDEQPDIQLQGFGIAERHCVIELDATTKELRLIPFDGARTCVNGAPVTQATVLRHGDRIVWGHHHFFKLSCPGGSQRPRSAPAAASSNSYTTTTQPHQQQLPPTQLSTATVADHTNRPIDFEFARDELLLNSNDQPQLQLAVKALEQQHEEDKQKALEKQRSMYEKQLQMLRNQMSPGTPYAPYGFDTFGSRTNLSSSTLSIAGQQQRVAAERWAEERDELFRKSLATLKQDISKANTLCLEAACLAQELRVPHTEFKVTLQIPAANLSPNRRKGAFVSEPAVLVKRKGRAPQLWSMEKLEMKLIDVRDLLFQRKASTTSDDGRPRRQSFVDPFHESHENHLLIGVANVFLEVLFQQVTLDYQVPIISQQGEVAGRLHVELGIVAGSLGRGERVADASVDDVSDTGSDSDDTASSSGSGGDRVRVRVAIKAARGLPLSLANFVFCQYSLCGAEPVVVAPSNDASGGQSNQESSTACFKFEHSREFTLHVTEELIEHCAEGALSIEVWGHRSPGFSTAARLRGWQLLQDAHAQQANICKSLADRWCELKRKLEVWVEIQELDDNGEYAPVEVRLDRDCGTGGIYQLRQGQQRRLVVRVQPVVDSGTLPLICEAVTSLAVGGVMNRSRIQRALDSYQEEEVTIRHLC